MLISPLRPSSTIRIFSSAENFLRVAFLNLLYNIVRFTHSKAPFRGKDARLWSRKPPISSSFLHAGNYLNLSSNSNNQPVPLYMTANNPMARQYLSTSSALWRYVLNRDKATAIQPIRNVYLPPITALTVFSTGWRFTMFIRKSCGVMFVLAKDIRKPWKR